MAAKKAAKTVKFRFAVLGSIPTSKTATKGVTIGHIRQKYSLEDLTIKVNGQTVEDDGYKVQDGDNVVVLTQVKSGC